MQCPYLPEKAHSHQESKRIAQAYVPQWAGLCEGMDNAGYDQNDTGKSCTKEKTGGKKPKRADRLMKRMPYDRTTSKEGLQGLQKTC